MYGKDLSSRSLTLNGGRCLLTRFCSRCSASTSVPVTITSTSCTRSGNCESVGRSRPRAWKYERTRGRSDFALPTYNSWPSASRNRYTPGFVGSPFSCSWTRSFITNAGYPGSMRRRFALVAALFLVVLPGRAVAGGPAMQVGASEDEVEQPTLAQTKAKLDLLKLAGLTTARVTVIWAPGQVGSRTAPLSDDDQESFAALAAAVAARFPTVRGITVSNEPNLNRFWLPQFNPDGTDAAAPAYERLLAKTYDAVKRVRPTMLVVGGAVSPRGGDNPDASRLTHSPTVFIQDMGAAYRASGRTTPIMDLFAIHPYGDNSSQPPTFQHPNSTSIGVGDYGKLVALLGQAFDGTAQPGSSLPILYDEY